MTSPTRDGWSRSEFIGDCFVACVCSFLLTLYLLETFA